MIGDSHRTAAMPCPGCGRGITRHMEVGPGQLGPEPGSVSICFYCSTISVYTGTSGGLTLRRATDTELDCYLGNPVIQHAIDVAREFRESRTR